jgi:hypothetical protein
MPKKSAPPKPFVGAIVHRQSTAGCQAAIVTRVYPDSVDLNGFGPTGAVPFVRLPEGTEPGCWHFPEES